MMNENNDDGRSLCIGLSPTVEPVPVSSPVAASIPSARKRDWRGRFLRNLRPTPEGSCEWLIWSKYWRSWHRKSSTGGACGYTDNVAEAGLFPRSRAIEYNDDRNTPYHVTEKIDVIRAAIAAHETALANLRTASGIAAGTDETAKEAQPVGQEPGAGTADAPVQP